MSEVTIRRFCESDLDQLYEMIHRAISIQLVTKVYEENDIVLMHDFYTKKYILGTSKLKNIYVAVLDGKVIGSIALNLDGDRTYVSMVYTDPDCQGKGIGRKLIEVAEQDELSQKTKVLYLHAMLTASNFYKKMGFGFTGKVPEIIIDCGLDFVTMEKHL